MDLFLEDKKITDNKKSYQMRRVLASGLTDAQLKDPIEIYNMLEEQVDATVKINYRLHRLKFGQLNPQSGENITDYVSRLHETAARCEFGKEELSEKLIESIIKITKFNDFWKDLLAKPKNQPINDTLEKGREYEALEASQASIKNLSATTINVDTVKKMCTNCGTSYTTRECPPYRTECGYYHNKGHWKKFCWKAKSQQEKFKGKPHLYLIYQEMSHLARYRSKTKRHKSTT